MNVDSILDDFGQIYLVFIKYYFKFYIVILFFKNLWFVMKKMKMDFSYNC